MNPKLLWLITAILLVYVPSTQANQIPHVGVLNAVNTPASREAAVQGLRELGLCGGKKYRHRLSVRRWSLRTFPELAAELVRVKVDVIVASGNPAIIALKKATQSIPIVMTGLLTPSELDLLPASLDRAVTLRD